MIFSSNTRSLPDTSDPGKTAATTTQPTLSTASCATRRDASQFQSAKQTNSKTFFCYVRITIAWNHSDNTVVWRWCCQPSNPFYCALQFPTVVPVPETWMFCNVWYRLHWWDEKRRIQPKSFDCKEGTGSPNMGGKNNAAAVLFGFYTHSLLHIQ